MHSHGGATRARKLYAHPKSYLVIDPDVHTESLARNAANIYHFLTTQMGASVNNSNNHILSQDTLVLPPS